MYFIYDCKRIYEPFGSRFLCTKHLLSYCFFWMSIWSSPMRLDSNSVKAITLEHSSLDLKDFKSMIYVITAFTRDRYWTLNLSQLNTLYAMSHLNSQRSIKIPPPLQLLGLQSVLLLSDLQTKILYTFYHFPTSDTFPTVI
jgi:hypothetical protein